MKARVFQQPLIKRPPAQLMKKHLVGVRFRLYFVNKKCLIEEAQFLGGVVGTYQFHPSDGHWLKRDTFTGRFSDIGWREDLDAVRELGARNEWVTVG